jgi:hypothetical protein
MRKPTSNRTSDGSMKTLPGADYLDEEKDLLNAIEANQKRAKKKFLRFAVMLDVAKVLGYRRRGRLEHLLERQALLRSTRRRSMLDQGCHGTHRAEPLAVM